MVTGLEPEDELLHIGPDGSDQSDCLEFTAYDIPVRLGGLFRLHSRPGRGYTQLTACLYLPDGRAAFVSERSGIGRGSHFDGGGLRVEVVRPYQEVQVAYDGKLLLLEDPGAMLHPERPPAEHPRVDAEVHLTYTGISTLYEAGDERGAAGRRTPPSEGHYEQLVSVFGSVRVDDVHWVVDGLGIRAHRWGPAPSPEPDYRRRMTANIGPSFGFMACRVATESGGGSRGGFVWDGTALHVCRGITIKTSWGGGDRVPRAVELSLKAGDQTWHAAGTVHSLLARPGDDDHDSCDGEGRPATRTCEALTEWRLDDGQVGYGLSEYVDRIVDGAPAGVDE
jgi:hypothetical protein